MHWFFSWHSLCAIPLGAAFFCCCSLSFCRFRGHIPCFLVFFFFLILFIYWLCWVFIAVCRLSLVAVSWDYSSSLVHGLLIVVASPYKACALGMQASVGSVVVAHRLGCSSACGIFPDQESNPCPLLWQTGPLGESFLLVFKARCLGGSSTQNLRVGMPNVKLKCLALQGK